MKLSLSVKSTVLNMTELNKLNKIVNSQIDFYHRNKALIFFEAAIGELLEKHGLKESKKIIKSYLDHLDEF